MSRRSWVEKALIAAVLGAGMMLAGCSTEWIKEAEQIVAAMIPAAANLVALVAALEGKSVSASDLQTVQSAGTQAGADLQLVASLMAAYQKADASAQPGILGQIQSALVAAQGDLSEVLPALHIQDAATQAKVTALVGIVLSEVQALAAVLPEGSQNSHPVAQTATRVGQTGTGTSAMAGLRPADSQGRLSPRSVSRVPLSADEFVKSYNATLTAKTGNVGLDRVTAGLKIHVHSAAARVVTAGVLK